MAGSVTGFRAWSLVSAVVEILAGNLAHVEAMRGLIE